jgi:nicotinamidase-related amidase
MKGQNLRTEMFSCLAAEVEDPKDHNTSFNYSLMASLKVSDRIIVCGQALSHCVNFTMRDIVDHWHEDCSNIILLSNGANDDPFQAFDN